MSGIVFRRTNFPPHYVIGHGISVSTTSHPIPFGWRGRRGWQDRAINPGESHLLTHGELNTPRWHRPFDGLSLVLDPQFVADVVQEHGAESDRIRQPTIGRLRVQRAIALAKRRDLLFAQIAAECGFHDHAHLTRAFRRVLGTTRTACLRRG